MSSVHPGYCLSDIQRDTPWYRRLYYVTLDFFIARTAEQGARQVIWAALGPDGNHGKHVRHLHGAYVATSEVREPSDYVISKEGYEAQERLWVSLACSEPSIY